MLRISSNKLLVAASLGLLAVAVVILLPWEGGTREVVPDVAAVRHSDVSEAPEAPDAAPEAADVRSMVASYYSSVLEGEPTASGEAYQPERYTAAHKTLPLGTEVRVRYGGEAVEVVVNDRGPFVAGRDIDLSLAAAREIGLTAPGTAPVRVTVL